MGLDSMKKNEPDNSKGKNSRRDFMRKLGLIGAAASTGAVVTGFSPAPGDDEEYVKVLTADNKLVEIPKSQVKQVKLDTEVLQSRGRVGIAGKRWVMVIDLAKCRNARECIKGCQEHHHLHPYQYHINTLVMQDNPQSAPYNMPKPCMHCDNPPCVSVCPVDATFKRQDGLVLIDNERCIGCRFCMAACPYSVRVFNWEKPFHDQLYKEEPMEYDVEANVPQRKGTITKCLFSADCLRGGELPTCVRACPNGVFYFGDENEDAVTNGTTRETVILSELLEKNAGYRLMEELGTKPRVYYLPPKDRVFETPEKPDNHHS
ncbi:prokaryotic molybdopterin-containing oxidoreductase family, iron-sulfur binding subunit [Saccharicrinis carchari]|uniref:Prokaryotic molybdopterin-containing oxidoreductase family, iron-sulfur binding subunit n=1 Tax=Saccharicrinis carchari TaxID=1168039 RepID=A0A521CKI8_SACCC|nr:4Fe-4S dicluster domain-containing protein [Saccharicrinis carchari]SMO59956.1 prokaryotic molybdopterin-containing oxidoreductase family, iron-sulfur binding subunit [Saccharicrinis carchari]